MARGWESKSVEAQQDEAGREKAPSRAAVSPGALARGTKREVLLLAKERTTRDLGKATAPAQQTMLTRALEDLDRTISELG